MSRYGGGLGMGSMYGSGMGMGGMYGSSMYGGMGSMYGGMGGMMGSMYGGMGGMYGMGGMMGMGGMGMGGMPGSEWEQRGHIAFMMLTRVLEALGMLAHVVQSLFGSSLQFATSYVGLSHQYQQLQQQQLEQQRGAAEDPAAQLPPELQRRGELLRMQLIPLPPGTTDCFDEEGREIPVTLVSDGQGGTIAALPASSVPPATWAAVQQQHEAHVQQALRQLQGLAGQQVQRRPQSAASLIWSAVKRLLVLWVLFVATRALLRRYRGSSAAGAGLTAAVPLLNVGARDRLQPPPVPEGFLPPPMDASSLAAAAPVLGAAGPFAV
jgi:hypothetical protein